MSKDIIVIHHYDKIILGYKKFSNLKDAEDFARKANKDYLKYADSSFYILDLNKLKEIEDLNEQPTSKPSEK
jgi:hypothetical protein